MSKYQKDATPTAILPGDMPLPCDVAVEAALIGCTLVNAEAFPLVCGSVVADDFFDPKHIAIWQAFGRLFEAGKPIEPVMIANELKAMKQLQEAGGYEYISKLTSMSAPMASVEHYVTVIKDLSSLRKIIHVSADITTEAYSGTYDVSEFLNRAEEKMFVAGERRNTKSLQFIGDLADQCIESMEIRKDANAVNIGISTGYENLDKITLGFKKQELTIIAARPSVGKSAVMLNLAWNIVRQGKSALIASLEMSSGQLTDRLMSLESGVDSQNIQTAKWLTRFDVEAMYRAQESIHKMQLSIDDKSNLTVMELRAKCKQLMARGPLDVVFVDYLQMMAPADMRVSREQQIANIGLGLVNIAKDLNIPVVSLAQLGRDSEKRTGDKRPQLSDLRESGALEAHAGVAILLFRPEMYAKTDKQKLELPESDKGSLEFIIAKNRNGPVDTAKMRFEGNTMAVVPWANQF